MLAHEAAASHDVPLTYVQLEDAVPSLSNAQDEILSAVEDATKVYNVHATNGVQVVDPIK